MAENEQEQGQGQGRRRSGSSQTQESPSQDEAKEAQALREDARIPGVATPKENEKLEHTEGGLNSRNDSHDLGVPMLQGAPAEDQGPEDAFGAGPKRGDYRERVYTDAHAGIALEGGGQPVYSEPDKAGNRAIVDYTPHSAVVPQSQNVHEIGEVPARKGGVET